jgi:hypothetical protein
MKFLLIAATLTAAAITSTAFAADVRVSITVGQPGFYGQIDIGDYPKPQVVNAQPVAIEAVPMNRPAIYLRVPPKYIKHWRKRCHEYNACGERVFFVQDDWYNRVYVPHYQELHRGHRDDRHLERNEGQRATNREERRDENRERERDHDR